MQSISSPREIIEALEKHQYVADEEFATALFLLLRLRKPLLLEGPPGVGKTEIAVVLSQLLETRLIRLQCYEGLDINAAVYEWNYQKQLLGIKLQEGAGLSVEEKAHHIFSQEYLLMRPLLQSIMEKRKAPVLLIDEIDRSDEEFEAFLLELLSVFQISIPELGTLKAKHKPYVILTSNRTRELSDALKRRCLYHWIDYPDLEKEMLIVNKRLPGIEQLLLQQVVGYVQEFRKRKLEKTPGVSETIDWAESLVALGYREMNAKAFVQTLGAVLKSVDDINQVKNEFAAS
ncbi:ATPase associated with various cellular activities AAA_5 [Niastella koreensis GR20-10]|uniref:ATPase associated with various cellular activities AAA_5 n=1 Tax=Niastella koreensis (strain DSM 17620 / KACC 11465 / NBRC 106392 / GR20-10) TaxID=700598 RepID=G8TB48_NIAKG|nr:MoxR family ATPase [Niastella koreensis]AEW01395.1 ATPase associated with various cellular activities AAA_5 [Niastella koreensis GR20-10]